jgi:hypothetical protein
MKYAVEIGSGFIKIGSGIYILIKGTHRQHGDRISLFLLLQNIGSRLLKILNILAYNILQEAAP